MRVRCWSEAESAHIVPMPMPLHYLIILSLFLQQVLIPAALLGGGAGGCDTAACCVVVEATTCCGESVREVLCGKWGGECYCGLEAENSQPTTDLPRPNDRTETGPVLLAFESATASPVLPQAQARKRFASSSSPLHSHRETQALLCIWTT